MRIPMSQYAEANVLAGSLPGKRAFGDMVGKTHGSPRPELCFLDFRGVATMTASFARDCVLAFRAHVRAMSPTIYPVAANLADAVREELELWLSQTGDAWIACDLAGDDVATNPIILGILDHKQSLTLTAVIALKETDVATLARDDDSVKTTAWNNRLVALSDKGLVIETTSGSRNKRYRPVLEGLNHGA